MSTHSTDGRPWAKLSELKEEDVLITDDGFTCMKEGEAKVVKKDKDGELYIKCDQKYHLLDGQLSEVNQDSLVGLWRKP